MTALLVFPPFTDPTQPNAGIPSLVAATRDCGVAVEVWDLNLDGWDYLLDRGRLTVWLRRIERELCRLDRRRALNSVERDRYLALADGFVRGAAAIPLIDHAPATMKSAEFFDTVAYGKAVNLIDAALSLVSAVFHPARVKWGRFWPAVSVQSGRAITRQATDRRTNPFVDFAREVFTPRLQRLAPNLLGLSVTYLDQVVPAMTLAAECKRVLPSTLVVLGGQIVSQWGKDVATANSLWKFVDVFVFNEGESALRGLIARHRQGLGYDDVPNLAFRKEGKFVFTGKVREDPKALPCPDYGGLPLSRYWSPEPVLTLSASRGCYWGKCAFCSVSPAFRGHFSPRPTEHVCRDISTLMARHGARLFTFGDDALPPAFVRDVLTLGVMPEGARWQAEMRWDAIKDVGCLPNLAAAGATNLIFGLESGSQEVLRRMCKGASLRHAKAVVNACATAGVGVNLQCFFGFPGESRCQAGDTLQFLRETVGQRTTVSCGTFEVQKGSDVDRRMGAFGICRLDAAPDDDLQIRFDHEPRRSTSGQNQLVARAAKLQRSQPPQIRCGASGHALVFLARGELSLPTAAKRTVRPADPLSLADGVACRTLQWSPDSLRQTAKVRRQLATYAYRVSSNGVVELGPLASALVRYASAGATIRDLMAPLAPQERRRVRSALALLVRKGILAPAGSPEVNVT